MREIEWVMSDKPEKTGTYFVAIVYGAGRGTYACHHWDSNEGWVSLNEGERVLAHISIEKIVKPKRQLLN